MASQPPTSARIEDLKARLRLDPKSRLFYPLAEDLRKAGRADEAEKVLRAGLEHHGTYLSAWMSLGRVLVEKGEHREATEVLMRALALDPGNVVCARLLANSYLAMGETLEAVKKFKLVRALLPADQDVEEQIERLEKQLDAERAGTFPPPAPPPEMPSEPVQTESPPPVPERQQRSPSEAAPATEDPEPFKEAPPLPDLAPPADAPEEQSLDADRDVFANEATPEEDSKSGDAPWQHRFAASPGASAENPEPAGFSETERAEVEERLPTTEEPFELDRAGDEPPRREEDDESEPPWQSDPAAASSDETTSTLTMAELYERQGHVESAREIYRRVLERDPGNEHVRKKLEGLGSRGEVDVERRGDSVKRLQGWLEKVGRRDV